jgi:hypothetical protein
MAKPSYLPEEVTSYFDEDENKLVFGSQIQLASTQLVYGAPKVYTVYDNVSGCPPARAAGTQIMRIDFTTTAASSYVLMHYSTIATYAGRIDHAMYFDDTSLGTTLTSTNSNSWKPINLHFTVTCSAGSHYTYMTANQSSATGCGTTWGRAVVMVYENT